MLIAVDSIKQQNLTTANLQLLEKLIESSDQIGLLANYLYHTNDYLTQVKDLNQKLDVHEERFKTIEKMAKFFEAEYSEIMQRKQALGTTIGKMDDYLGESLKELRESLQKDTQSFNTALGEQQDALQQKLEETKALVSELQKLPNIKECFNKLEVATRQQNKEIEKLAESIRKLATVEVSQTTRTLQNRETSATSGKNKSKKKKGLFKRIKENLRNKFNPIK